MTGIEIASVAIAAAGLVAGTVQGVEQQRAVKKGRQDQQKAQQQAEAASAAQQKQTAQAAKQARAKRPDILELLGANLGPKLPSTNLTGPGGLAGLGTTSGLGQ